MHVNRIGFFTSLYYNNIMTQTQWKHSSREGFTGNNNEAEDSHTRSILEKLNKSKSTPEPLTKYDFCLLTKPKDENNFLLSGF